MLERLPNPVRAVRSMSGELPAGLHAGLLRLLLETTKSPLFSANRLVWQPVKVRVQPRSALSHAVSPASSSAPPCSQWSSSISNRPPIPRTASPHARICAYKVPAAALTMAASRLVFPQLGVAGLLQHLPVTVRRL